MKVDRRPALCLAAVAMTATLAACGSSGTGATTAAGQGGAPTSTSASAAKTSAATGSQTSTTNGCPSASAVSSALGSTVNAPQLTNQASTVMCSYPTASGGIVAISRYADAQYSADDVRGALQSQVQALGGSADNVHSVSGIGDAAFEFTQDGATTLGIVSGSAYIAVIGAPSSAAALAIAKLVV